MKAIGENDFPDVLWEQNKPFADALCEQNEESSHVDNLSYYGLITVIFVHKLDFDPKLLEEIKRRA